MSERMPETNPLPNPNASILTAPPKPPKPAFKDQVMFWFLSGSLVVIALILALMLYWSWAPSRPLEVKNSPFPARIEADPTGKTAGTVYLTAKYCKATSAYGQVRISFISRSREQFTPILTEKLKKGCGDFEFPIAIPSNLSEDEYRIKFHVEYNENPIRNNIPVDFESQPVDIGPTKNVQG